MCARACTRGVCACVCGDRESSSLTLSKILTIAQYFISTVRVKRYIFRN